MLIASDIIRGHTDSIILARLIHRDSYGYEINKSIYKLSNNKYEFKEATLYSAFKRLEEAGLIISYWGNENSGARRKYYSITDKGRIEYDNLTQNWNNTKQIIDQLLELEDKNER